MRFLRSVLASLFALGLMFAPGVAIATAQHPLLESVRSLLPLTVVDRENKTIGRLMDNQLVVIARDEVVFGAVLTARGFAQYPVWFAEPGCQGTAYMSRIASEPFPRMAAVVGTKAYIPVEDTSTDVLVSQRSYLGPTDDGFLTSLDVTCFAMDTPREDTMARVEHIVTLPEFKAPFRIR
jgi:hypothetical protein